MQCVTCGEELREGARFCPTCGTPTPVQPASTAPPSGTSTTVQIVRPRDASEARRDMPLPPPSAEFEPPSEPNYAQPNAGYTDRGGDPMRKAGSEFSPPDTGTGAGYTSDYPSSPSDAVYARPDAGYAGSTTGQRPMGRSALGAVSGADFGALGRRLMRLLKLDTSVFAEVYTDTAATIPIAVFVAAVLLISGIGGYLYIDSLVGFDVYDFGGSGAGEFFVRSVILGTVFGMVMWAAWSGVTMLVLQQLARVQSDFLGIARVIGLALGPLVLAILLVIDELFIGLSWIVLGAVASLAAIGVLEARDVRPGHGWLAALAGFAVFIIVLTILGDDFRDLAPGFFAIG